MSFKKFLDKVIDDYKKSQTPKEIKKKIEKEKLLRELEEEKQKRREVLNKKNLIIGGEKND